MVLIHSIGVRMILGSLFLARNNIKMPLRHLRLFSNSAPARAEINWESRRTVFSMKNVTKRVMGSQRILFRDVSLNFLYGAKIGIVGKNGAGKSSLMKIISGLDTSFEGDARPSSNVRIEFFSQEPKLDESLNVYDNIMSGLQHLKKYVDEYEKVSQMFAEPDADYDSLMERHAKLQQVIDDRDLWNLDTRVQLAMECLNCPPAEASVVDLSGGEKRRVALARMLLSEPDILLLDEPTNHLDANSVAWVEQYLHAYKGTVIAVTHDRFFLENLANFILEIDNGRLIPYKGNYSDWLETKATRLEMGKKKEDALAKRLKSEISRIRNPKASKNVKASYEELKEEYMNVSAKDRMASGSLLIPAGSGLSGICLEVSSLSKSIEGKTLFKDLSFQVLPGQIWGIVGKNGCGKSTLFRILTGEIEADSGSVKFGKTVDLGFAKQNRHFSNEENTVATEIAGNDKFVSLGNQLNPMPIRQFVAQFNFAGESQDKRIRELSGGERNRVHLAKLLKKGHNFLLFDEPTNDLDIDTLRSLEAGLQVFPGSAIVISHDRWFLDNVCTNLLVFGDDGTVTKFSGSWSNYAHLHRKNFDEDKIKRSARAASFL